MVHIDPLRPPAAAAPKSAYRRLAQDDSKHDGTYCNGVTHLHVQETLHRYSGFPLSITEGACDCVAPARA